MHVPSATAMIPSPVNHDNSDDNHAVFLGVNNFGSSTLSEGDLVNLPSFVAKLNKADRKFDRWLAGKLSVFTKDALNAYARQSFDPNILLQKLLEDLNNIIRGNSIYEESRFAGINLREGTKNIIIQKPPTCNSDRLNRMLIEDAYPLDFVIPFDNVGLLPLRYAAQDAIAVASLFIETIKFVPPNRAILLLGCSPCEISPNYMEIVRRLDALNVSIIMSATNQETIQALNRVKTDHTKNNNTFLFFASTHGAHTSGYDGIFLQDTSFITWKSIAETISNNGFSKQLMVLDACRDAKTSFSPSIENLETLKTTQVISDYSLTLIQSSGEYNKSYEEPYVNHGLFTYFFLRSFYQSLRACQTTTITPQDLTYYVQECLSLYQTLKQDPPQLPQISVFGTENNIELCAVTPVSNQYVTNLLDCSMIISNELLPLHEQNIKGLEVYWTSFLTKLQHDHFPRKDLEKSLYVVSLSKELFYENDPRTRSLAIILEKVILAIQSQLARPPILPITYLPG